MKQHYCMCGLVCTLRKVGSVLYCSTGSAQTAALLQAVWEILDKSPINDCKKGRSKREAQANLIRFLPRLMTYIMAEFISQTYQGSIVQETD